MGYQGTPRAAHYAATKAYVQTFAEGLHHEFKSKGVDVLSSAPGPVRSGFAARSRMTVGGADNPEQVSRGTLAALGRRMTVTPGPHSTSRKRFSTLPFRAVFGMGRQPSHVICRYGRR